MIAASTHEIRPGGTTQLVATVVDAAGVMMSGRALTWSSSDETVATVSAGGLVRGIGGGQVVIRATSGGVSGAIDMTVAWGPCRAEVARPMSPGQTYEESLRTWDCVLMDAPYADGWTLSLAEPATLMISMRSEAFEPVLLVTTPDMDFLALAFDGSGGGAADLAYGFEPGEYVVWATSYGVGDTGAYRLGSSVVEVASCEDPQGAITFGGAVTGSLDPTDCRRSGGLSDAWSFHVGSAARMQVDLTSDAFDTILEIVDATGRTVAWDDDGGEGFNSRFVGDFAAGSYTIWVSSFGGFGSGPYRLSVGPPSTASTVAEPEARRVAPPSWIDLVGTVPGGGGGSSLKR
ncbi:MAG TPA: Ig-like domain-containing protein [Longimicrobiales bacterium]|nr:Ig-like domain-containing protein [Longimicrobiales bacterium]